MTYNAEAVLEDTIQSVISQTYHHVEYILVDGASKDGTLSIIDRYRDRITRIVSEPDKRLYDAMNKGLSKARGRFIVFLNAGDSFSTPGTLALYAQAATDGTDIIYADTRLVDSRRRVLGPRHLSVPGRLTFRSFASGMLVCHQAFCVRRSLAPAYDLRYRFSADYEWCLRCLKATSPERCVNLRTIAIDYLTEGLTDQNHKASLKERYHIMCRYYGTLPTLLRHVWFAVRALMRR